MTLPAATLRLYVGGRDTGVEIRRDPTYGAIWRVIDPKGAIGDRLNLERARDAAVALAIRARGSGLSGELVRWDARDAPPRGPWGAQFDPGITETGPPSDAPDPSKKESPQPGVQAGAKLSLEL